jgi:hypothetical protein
MSDLTGHLCFVLGHERAGADIREKMTNMEVNEHSFAQEATAGEWSMSGQAQVLSKTVPSLTATINDHSTEHTRLGAHTPAAPRRPPLALSIDTRRSEGA